MPLNNPGAGGVSTITDQTQETLVFGEVISAFDPVLVKHGITAQAAPAVLPASTGNKCAWSHDNVYLAVAHNNTPFLTIYKMTDGVPVALVTPLSALPASTAHDVAWSNDDGHLAVAHATAPYITVYSRSGDAFTKLDNPATTPTTTAVSVEWANNGSFDFLATMQGTTPWINAYKLDAGVLTRIATPADLPTGTGYDASWVPGGSYLAVANSLSPYLRLYSFDGTTLTKEADPTPAILEAHKQIEFSPDGLKLAVAGFSGTTLTYTRSGAVLTAYSPETLKHGSALQAVCWKSDGNYMLVAGNPVPYIRLYKVRNGIAYHTDAITAPAGTGNGCSWSPDSTLIAVAHATTPFITVYDVRELVMLADTGSQWNAANAIKAGYSKEAGVLNDSKKVIVTHRL